MERNGVLEHGKPLMDFTKLRGQKGDELAQAEANARAAWLQEMRYYKEQNPGAGVVLEREEMLVDVEGFKGKLSEAPALSAAPNRPGHKDCLWVQKTDPGDKDTFLALAPAMQGMWTHWRGEGRGSVICFEDHSLCAGGHDEGTLRWHGFLHAMHYEKNRQCFCYFTPEGARHFLDQLNEEEPLRGLKFVVRRAKKKNGPFYVEICDGPTPDMRRMAKHRDARASIYRYFKIQPPKGRDNAAFSGGEEIPVGR